jgi:hypothetical protein
VLVTHDIGIAAWSKGVVTFSDGRIVSDKPAADVVPESVRAGIDEAVRGVAPQGVPV